MFWDFTMPYIIYPQHYLPNLPLKHTYKTISITLLTLKLKLKTRLQLYLQDAFSYPG